MAIKIKSSDLTAEESAFLESNRGKMPPALLKDRLKTMVLKRMKSEESPFSGGSSSGRGISGSFDQSNFDRGFQSGKDAFKDTMQSIKRREASGEISPTGAAIRTIAASPQAILPVTRGAADAVITPVLETTGFDKKFQIIGGASNLMADFMDWATAPLQDVLREDVIGEDNIKAIQKTIDDNSDDLMLTARSAEAFLDLMGLKIVQKPLKATVSETAEKLTKENLKNGIDSLKKKVTENAVKMQPKFKSMADSMRISPNPKEVLEKALRDKNVNVLEAEQLAKEFGVDLPAASVSSPLAAKAEQILGEGLFGGKIKAKAEKAIKDFSDSVAEISKKAPSKEELGENIFKRFEDIESQRKQVINDLYSQAEDIIQKSGNTIEIGTDNAKQFAQELFNRKQTALKTGIGKPKEVKFFGDLIKGLDANKDISTLRATLKEIGERANFSNFNPTTDEKNFRKLYHALKKDIDEGIGNKVPNLAKTLEEANKQFAAFEELRQRPFAKSIKKLGEKGDVDTIADKITKTSASSNEIRQIYETLGPDTKKQIQDRIMSDIIEKAKSASGDFTPGGFTKQIKKLGDEKLNAIFTKDQVALLKRIDKMNSLLVKGTSVARGSQTARLQQVDKWLDLGRGVAAFSTSGASLLGEWMLATLFGSKKGQNFLKGLNPKNIDAIKGGIKNLAEN